MTRGEAIRRFQRMKKILSIPNSDAERTKEAIDMAIEALSAETVQGWIPVSERLPDSDRPVLVTIQWTDFDREVSVGEYWDNPTKAAPESEKGWGTYGDHVTAWREMPEPWRGENDD